VAAAIYPTMELLPPLSEFADYRTAVGEQCLLP
jgi:hypothetical protein